MLNALASGSTVQKNVDVKLRNVSFTGTDTSGIVLSGSTVNGDVNFDEYVKKIALEKGLKIKKVEYGFVETIKRKHESIYLPSPEQFVQWLSHAEYVVTDSFHATAFSINMNRQMSVVCPEQFSTRIRNILKLTNLESRIKTVESMPEECTIDYSISNKIMREEREKSLSVIGEMIGQK